MTLFPKDADTSLLLSLSNPSTLHYFSPAMVPDHLGKGISSGSWALMTRSSAEDTSGFLMSRKLSPRSVDALGQVCSL